MGKIRWMNYLPYGLGCHVLADVKPPEQFLALKIGERTVKADDALRHLLRYSALHGSSMFTVCVCVHERERGLYGRRLSGVITA
jgi:hypothetical protein